MYCRFWQRFTLFGLMVVCWVMEVVSWVVGPADSELWYVLYYSYYCTATLPTSIIIITVIL